MFLVFCGEGVEVELFDFKFDSIVSDVDYYCFVYFVIFGVG